MSVAARALRKIWWTRPFPQIRTLRRYDVSPMRQPRLYVRFIVRGRETSNFTYELANQAELAVFVANALGRPWQEIAGYIDELDGDKEFLSAVSERLRQRKGGSNKPMFGRRIGWYCIVRAVSPGVVVETGTADGLGTVLLARALARNAEEGFRGELLSFDIDPRSGWLLDESSASHVRLLIGDSAVTLPRALSGREVDVFIHDSDHSYVHEKAELALALDHAAERLVLISDNAHATTALHEICTDLGLDYLLFRERPLDHFYPGAGIGMAIVTRGVGVSMDDGQQIVGGSHPPDVDRAKGSEKGSEL